MASQRDMHRVGRIRFGFANQQTGDAGRVLAHDLREKRPMSELARPTSREGFKPAVDIGRKPDLDHATDLDEVHARDTAMIAPRCLRGRPSRHSSKASSSIISARCTAAA
jgi:hypothetical protein